MRKKVAAIATSQCANFVADCNIRLSIASFALEILGTAAWYRRNQSGGNDLDQGAEAGDFICTSGHYLRGPERTGARREKDKDRLFDRSDEWRTLANGPRFV